MSELGYRLAAGPMFETHGGEMGQQPLDLVTELAHPSVARLPFPAQLADHQLAVADDLKVELVGQKPTIMGRRQSPAEAGQQRPILRFVVGPPAEVQAIEDIDPGGVPPPDNPVGAVGRARVPPASSIETQTQGALPGHRRHAPRQMTARL